MTNPEQIVKFAGLVQEFVEKANKMCAENLKDTKLVPPIFKADMGEKWVRVYRHRFDGEGKPYVRESIYAFIAATDFGNKTLGQMKAGDIHKPASFSQPAKHARANLFNPDYPKCMTPYGITYLK